MDGCDYSSKPGKNEQFGFMCAILPRYTIDVRANVLLESLKYSYDEDKYDVTMQALSPLHIYAPWTTTSQPVTKSLNLFDGYKSSLKAIKKHLVSQCNKHFGQLPTGVEGKKRVETKLPSFVWTHIGKTDVLPTVNGNVHVRIFLSKKLHKVSTPTRRKYVPRDQTPKKTQFAPPTWQDYSMEEKFQRVLTTTPVLIKSQPEKIMDDKLSINEEQEIKDKIRAWSHTQTGKLKDIRSLLSTIDEVIWEDASWKTMPMSMLVGDKDSIKKYYRFVYIYYIQYS
ncbi:hypothetical protein BEWA_030620 [Theileria equi strain WA]|uniref:Uncharacterized protein n=1 Tax=Theileria equi strain WA TaxID=1537102 RepID=L0AZ77_THEEQ|nr:hypothetical protein BEWA_030620 [Theileria equi strain WA]AFZ80209.1 hypothetical protein BEWA_030620 [Theileria equi strain WA]|eukprot:XP_004829875.1 hypothetical protein BEWA_030620 [Theileria equi strain WA]